MKTELLSIKHSIVAVGLLTLYGGAVCPFVDSLHISTVFFIFTAAFVCAWALKFLLSRTVTAPYNSPLLLRLGVDFTIYFFAAIFVISFNTLNYDFPISSGLKLLVGLVAIGLFASIDNQIHLEYQRIKNNDVKPQLLLNHTFFPVTKKLSLIFSLLMLVTAFIIGLVVINDASYLLEGKFQSAKQAKLAVLLDVVFVIVVLLFYGLRILFSYSKNMALLFNKQLTSLHDVKSGNLQTLVPITTTDEFAHIAIGTNEMIAGLLEKERIRTIFGKVVSPEIATSLIDSHEGNLRIGSRKNVTILFCDIREFTDISENAEPQAVLTMLNEYFEKMVTIIHARGGIVDKFIGDAILAVFGISNEGNKIDAESAENAVLAAIEMSIEVKSIFTPQGKPLKNGFGIHSGSVFAGTVGSTERYEYTIIGDTVNTASRLEGLCKNINREIIVSKTVYDFLSYSLQSSFIEEERQTLKGKSNKVSIFGYVQKFSESVQTVGICQPHMDS